MPKKKNAPADIDEAASMKDAFPEAKQQKALLREALQSAIFNSANFSSIATDSNGVIQIFNVGAERMLGYMAADVMNKITPADLSDPQELIARAEALSAELDTPITPGFEALVFKAARGIEDIYELTYIRKDGSRFPAVVSVTALRDAQNKIIGYLLIGTDNTARKQVEADQKKLDQRLRDQQFYTRSLIESNIDALMTTDPSGIITDVNKQMEALTGCTRDELIGAPFKNYFTDPQRAEAGIKQVLNEKKVTDYELTARARDGKKTVVSYNASTFYDRDRKLQGVFAAARDVTEQKQASQYARSLIEASLDPLVTISPDGKITDVNAASVQATGVPREQLIGTDFSDYFTEPDKAREGYQKVFSDGLVRDYPLAIRHKTGSIMDVLYNAAVYKDDKDKVLGVFAAARDVTEQKQASRYARSLIDASLDPLVTISPDGKITDVNEASEQATGVPRKQLIGTDFSDYFTEPDKAREGYQKVFSDGFVRDYPLAIRHKTGSIMDVLYNATVYKDDKDNVLGVFAAARDVTELKRLEQMLKDKNAEALQASEERFKTMFLQAPLGIALIDSQNGHLYEVNPRFAEITGRSMEEMENIDWLQITHPDDVQTDLENMALLNAGKINGFQMEKRYLRPDDTVVWINMTVSPLNARDEAHPRHLAMIKDITERKANEARIKHLNRVYAVLSGINSLIVRVRDRDKLFREACRISVEDGGFLMAMLCMVDLQTKKIVPVATAGMHEDLLTGIKDLLASSADTSKTLVAQAISEKQVIVSNDSSNDPRVVFGKKYAESGIFSVVILPLVVSGEAVGALALYAGETDFFHEEELKLLMELAEDITFAINYIEKLERITYLAYYDTLTGLANRSLFFERVAEYIRSAANGGHKLAISLIDLERFRNINNNLGRAAGDALLKQVAKWMTRHTRDVNLLARIDADHFAVVLPETRQDGDLTQLIEKMTQAFQEHPFRLNNAEFRIAATVGTARFPDDGANAETLFKNAEAALKKAKAGGDRCLLYKREMTEALAGRLELENQMRQAIDNEEFVLYYQPKVNLASGKVASAEALIRWNDPRSGLTLPGKFIPILEETGLIQEVGHWALHKAIADNLRWRSAGLPAVRTAVNVSALQLHHPGFIAELEQAIAIDAHAAEGLELEITESMIMEDIQHNIASLEAIRSMGITIAIDDFGTGFSSLGYLSRLPVNTLKIDRAFVIEMTTGSEGLALVTTIINLAHAFKLKVVAEGVETEEQLELLRSLGCDDIQGFLFSKAVPCEEFETRFLTA